MVLPRSISPTYIVADSTLRKVLQIEARSLATNWGYPYFETSAVTGAQISNLFKAMKDEIQTRRQKSIGPAVTNPDQEGTVQQETFLSWKKKYAVIKGTSLYLFKSKESFSAGALPTEQFNTMHCTIKSDAKTQKFIVSNAGKTYVLKFTENFDDWMTLLAINPTTGTSLTDSLDFVTTTNSPQLTLRPKSRKL